MTDYNLGQTPQLQTNPAMALANVGEILGSLVASGPQGAQQAAGRISERDEGARQRAWNAFTRMQDMQYQAAQKQMDRNHDAAMRRMEHSLTKGDEIKQAAGQLTALFNANPAQFETFKAVNPQLGLDPEAPSNVWALTAAQTFGGRGALATFEGMAPRTEAEAALAARGVTLEQGQDALQVQSQLVRDESAASSLLDDHTARLTSISDRLDKARANGATPEEMKGIIASLNTELAGWQDRFEALGSTYDSFFQPGGYGDSVGLPGKFSSTAAHAATLASSLGFVDNANLRRAAVGTNPRQLRASSPLFAPDILASPELRAEAVADYSAAHGEPFNTQLQRIATEDPETLIAVFTEEVYTNTIKPLIDGGRDFNQLIDSASALQASGTQAGEAMAEIDLISRFASLGDRGAEIARHNAIENQVDTQLNLFGNQLNVLGMELGDFEGIDIEDALRGTIEYNPRDGATVKEGGVFMNEQIVDRVFSTLHSQYAETEVDDPLAGAAVLAKRIRSLGDTPLANALRGKANRLFSTMYQATGGAPELHPDLAAFNLSVDQAPTAVGNIDQLGRRSVDIYDALTTPQVPAFLTPTGEDGDAAVTWVGISEELMRGKQQFVVTRPLRSKDDAIKSPLVRGNPVAGIYRKHRGSLRTLPAYDDLPPRVAEAMRKDLSLSPGEFAAEYGRLRDAIRLHDFMALSLEPSNPMYGVQQRLNEMEPRAVYNTVIAGPGMPLGDLFPNQGEIPYATLGFGPSVDYAYESVAYGSNARSAADLAALNREGMEIIQDLDRRMALVEGSGLPGLGFEPFIDIDTTAGPGETLRAIDRQAIDAAKTEVAQRLERIQGEEAVLADQSGARGALDRGLVFGLLQYVADHPQLDLSGREEFATVIKDQVEPLFGESLVPGIEKGPALMAALTQELKNATDAEAAIRGMFRGSSVMLGQLISESKEIPVGKQRSAAIKASKGAFDRSLRDIEALALSDWILELPMSDIGDATVLAELEQIGWDKMKVTGSDEEIANARWYRAAALWGAMNKAAYAREQ